MDEKEWLMTPPNNWKSEEVVDVLLKAQDVMGDYDVAEGLSELDELITRQREALRRESDINLEYQKRIAELEGTLRKIANAEDIFYDEYTGVYFSDLQEMAKKELSDD